MSTKIQDHSSFLNKFSTISFVLRLPTFITRSPYYNGDADNNEVNITANEYYKYCKYSYLILDPRLTIYIYDLALKLDNTSLLFKLISNFLRASSYNGTDKAKTYDS